MLHLLIYSPERGGVHLSSGEHQFIDNEDLIVNTDRAGERRSVRGKPCVPFNHLGDADFED